jgi:hypothetical protein
VCHWQWLPSDLRLAVICAVAQLGDVRPRDALMLTIVVSPKPLFNRLLWEARQSNKGLPV